MPKNSLKNILITDRFTEEAWQDLSSKTFLKAQPSLSVDLQSDDLTQVHGLIIRSRTKITETTLKRAKNLQVIVSATSGFDHIDLNATQKWGVTVMHTPNANVESAAQLTWALIFSCANRILQASAQVKSGQWQKELITGTELSQKTLGVVGFGRIGRRVAEVGECLGMRVCAFDPYLETSVFQEHSVQSADFESLLKMSDVITFHVPKTKHTHHMLSRPHFQLLRKGAIVINASRGGVIEEAALAEALRLQNLAAAGLDVFENEPAVDAQLLQSPSAVLTPHVGANTVDAFKKASMQSAEKILRFFIDGSTEDTLPPKAAWYQP